MIKRILSICCIGILMISVIGCSGKNTADKATNETKSETAEASNATAEEDGNNKETAIADKGNNKVVDENESTKTNKGNAVDSKKNQGIQDSLKQKDKIQLKGKINNNLDIHMELQAINKKSFEDFGEPGLSQDTSMDYDIQPETLYEGSYYYDQYKKNIRIEAEAFSNGYFIIKEFDENNAQSGYFGGFTDSGNIIKGRWDNNKDSNYPFYLAESTSSIKEADLNEDTDKIGIYHTKGSNDTTYYEYLTIIAVSDNKFKFHISGYSEPNIGNVGGIANFTDESKKEATFDDGNGCKINFKFDGSTINVSGTEIEKYAGAHVRLDGAFEKINKN